MAFPLLLGLGALAGTAAVGADYLDKRRQGQDIKDMALRKARSDAAQVALAGLYRGAQGQWGDGWRDRLAQEVEQGSDLGQQISALNREAYGLSAAAPATTGRQLSAPAVFGGGASEAEGPQSQMPVMSGYGNGEPPTAMMPSQASGASLPLWTPQPEKGVTLGRDQRLVDPMTGRVRAAAMPEEFTMRPGELRYQAAPGSDPRVIAQGNPEQFTLGEGQQRFVIGSDGQPRQVAAGPPLQPSWNNPIAVMGADGNPQMMQFSNRGGSRQLPGVAPIPQKGMTVFDPATGRPIMTTDPTAAKIIQAQPTQATQTDIQKKQLQLKDTAANIRELENNFDPTLQGIGKRLNVALLAGKEKLGAALTPQEQQDVAQMTQQRAAAFNVLNNELNRLSGAAVTENELRRLTQSLPNPGAGVFDGDSPTEFLAKMRRATKSIKSSIARYNYAQRFGFRSLEELAASVPLEEMPTVIRHRGMQIEAEIKQANPNANEGDIQAEVKKRLSAEFGI